MNDPGGKVTGGKPAEARARRSEMGDVTSSTIHLTLTDIDLCNNTRA